MTDMTEAQAKLLRLPFDPGEVDQLPRVWHKGKADERTIQLDYVGHATVTDRLLAVDPEWTWEPFAVDEQGLPRIVERGDCLELWLRLTVAGTTRIGVGTVAVEHDRQTGERYAWDQDTAKELIGDAIRNAAMRFGVALDLWRKHGGSEPATAEPGRECPHCHAPSVVFNAEPRGKKPAWSCQNRGCGGGSPRKEGGGNWPWGSYEADYFSKKEAEETGGALTVTAPGTEGKPEVPADAFDDLTCNLEVLGISREQAEAELEALKADTGFSAGHVKDMRAKVNRACVLLVALGLEPSGIQGELWREWQGADLENRRILSWGTVKGREVQQFAEHVQAFLRVRG